jgi:hypothetical protein
LTKPDGENNLLPHATGQNLRTFVKLNRIQDPSPYKGHSDIAMISTSTCALPDLVMTSVPKLAAASISPKVKFQSVISYQNETPAHIPTPRYCGS